MTEYGKFKVLKKSGFTFFSRPEYTNGKVKTHMYWKEDGKWHKMTRTGRTFSNNPKDVKVEVLDSDLSVKDFIGYLKNPTGDIDLDALFAMIDPVQLKKEIAIFKRQLEEQKGKGKGKVSKKERMKGQIMKKYPQLNDDSAELVMKVVDKTPKKEMKGKGMFDKIVNKTVKLYNKVRGKKTDPRSHVLKEGERHAILMDKNGGLAGAKFIGPNTDLRGNLNELLEKHGGNISLALADKNFVAKSDKVAAAHDLRYQLYANQPKKVRDADERMVRRLKELKKNKEDKNFNINPALLGIAGKMKLEDKGIMKKGSFATDPYTDVTPKEQKLWEKAEEHLRMQGYGDNPKGRPKRRKPSTSPWVVHVKAYAEKHGLTYRESMSAARESYHKK